MLLSEKGYELKARRKLLQGTFFKGINLQCLEVSLPCTRNSICRLARENHPFQMLLLLNIQKYIQ